MARRLVAAGIFFLALAGCSTPSAMQPAKVNLAGYPPGFKEGYADGCASAHSLLATRDDKRYKSDTQYASGWNDGRDLCAAR